MHNLLHTVFYVLVVSQLLPQYISIPWSIKNVAVWFRVPNLNIIIIITLFRQKIRI